jgi:hypothetical protein
MIGACHSRIAARTTLIVNRMTLIVKRMTAIVERHPLTARSNMMTLPTHRSSCGPDTVARPSRPRPQRALAQRRDRVQ